MSLENFNRTDDMFSLCGLNCGLCGYRLQGHCSGCFKDSFCAKNCPMAPCSVKHGNIQYCFECPEYPCRYYGTLFERVPVDHVADADLIGVPGYHVEVKRVEKLNINTATEQAKRDHAEGTVPAVFHRKNLPDLM